MEMQNKRRFNLKWLTKKNEILSMTTIHVLAFDPTDAKLDNTWHQRTSVQSVYMDARAVECGGRMNCLQSMRF